MKTTKDISFILSGRDDGYTGNFIERFVKALEINIPLLDQSELEYEFILVDYNPTGAMLSEHPQLSEFLAHPCVRNIVVDRSVLVAEGLPPHMFYEYFAKNIGAVNAAGELLFMTNADIVLSEGVIKHIKDVVLKDDFDTKFYRFRYRQEVQLNGQLLGGPTDLYHPEDVDGVVCGGYSGDATIFSKRVFCEVSTGYNEMDPGHKTNNGQASMDGEILWNLYKQGLKMELVGHTYYHVTHPRPSKDTAYSRETYENKKGWGCAGYPTLELNENTIKIYSE